MLSGDWFWGNIILIMRFRIRVFDSRSERAESLEKRKIHIVLHPYQFYNGSCPFLKAADDHPYTLFGFYIYILQLPSQSSPPFKSVCFRICMFPACQQSFPPHISCYRSRCASLLLFADFHFHSISWPCLGLVFPPYIFAAPFLLTFCHCDDYRDAVKVFAILVFDEWWLPISLPLFEGAHLSAIISHYWAIINSRLSTLLISGLPFKLSWS